MLRNIIKLISCISIGLVICCKEKGTVESEAFSVELETIAKGNEKEYTWTHARSAVIPSDKPKVLTTMSQTLKEGSDVYHDLYQVISQDMGQTWSEPEAIPSLTIIEQDSGYRSVVDMWPQWHSSTNKVLNIGTSPFYSNERTHDGWKKKVVYACFDPETEKWSSPKFLKLPELDHDGMLLMAPAAGSAQWLELPNGDILLPVFYFKLTEEQAYSALNNPDEAFSIGSLMKSDDFGFSSTVVRCTFDGENLIYKAHGDELILKQGRGIYEPSITSFKGEYYLTMRSDKSAYVAKSKDGLHFSSLKEWTFDDESILGSYNTQQHWVRHSDALYLVYTRRGADNDEVFRHRAPLFMAEVDVNNLQVIRSTEREMVPNRGVALGNFGIMEVNQNETWITVAEYMRGEENVVADNSVFTAKIKWKRPNLNSKQ
ncbi:sialidase family protein [Cyclobacterium sp. 1_MG-2023]|uniref:sialidase family protein n=1 Tax=Cyclobacterium sp. 1_MG-2023 TaxID=3062681 RepID=UPI0026E13829|nr:sialidase family protein [Cyclobacterium sp. 1_MG-2023]MDO6437137.1 sialidase family protein [Cyclobacterium sp. 1_MG-2023]